MTKTFQELREVDVLIGKLYEADPDLRNGKFGYAYKKFSKWNYEPIVNEFTDEISMVRLNNAMEDPTTKEVLTNPADSRGRGYRYTKDGLKKVIAEEKGIIEKYNAKEIEIKPYISSSAPSDLTEEDREMLTGLVL